MTYIESFKQLTSDDVRFLLRRCPGTEKTVAYSFQMTEIEEAKAFLEKILEGEGQVQFAFCERLLLRFLIHEKLLTNN